MVMRVMRSRWSGGAAAGIGTAPKQPFGLPMRDWHCAPSSVTGSTRGSPQEPAELQRQTEAGCGFVDDAPAAHWRACRGQRYALPTEPAFAHKLHSLALSCS